MRDWWRAEGNRWKEAGAWLAAIWDRSDPLARAMLVAGGVTTMLAAVLFGILIG